MTLYDQAKQLLFAEYHRNYEIVKDSPFHRDYVDEKIRHSLQVSGAGNAILRGEPCFQNRDQAFLDIAKTAILLHDIYRFNEVRIWYETGEKSDHGAKGAEFLETIPVFNHPLVIFPVKHHGHMIEDFYKDPEYQAIEDPKLKKDIESILFAVRDADKIANWNLVINEFDNMQHLWIPFANDFSPVQRVVNPAVWQCFIQYGVIPHKDVKTNMDEFLAVLCWLFDVNYAASINYCLKLNLFKKYMEFFKRMKAPDEILNDIKKTVDNFLKERFKVSVHF